MDPHASSAATQGPAPIVFVLGAPRSGTTLLRVMLEGHPQLFSPPEMVIAPFATMAERRAKLEERFWEKGGLRRALMEIEGLEVDDAKALEASLEGKTVPETYAWLMERIGPRILVDKCPHLAVEVEAMRRVGRWFPDARYVWIVRHPGSVTRSLQNMPMAEVMLQGYDAGPRELWHQANVNIETFLSDIPRERWARVRYEDLVEAPEAPLRAICDALGLGFEEAMTRPYEGDRMREGPSGARAVGDPNMASRGRIQPELATRWLEGFDPRTVSSATRVMAARYGYDLDSMALPPIARVSDGIASLFELARQLEQGIELPMDVDAVEGRRFLLRMLSSSVDMFVEQSDFERPVFYHSEGPHRKMFGDNPDADYLRAPVRMGPGRVYRVWGRIPAGCLYVSVLLYGKGGRVAGSLIDGALQPDDDGRFSALISTEPQEGPWLAADGDENAVIVRQYFTDRTKEEAIEVHIEKVGELAPPGPLTAVAMERQLELAKRMLAAVFERTQRAYGLVSALALKKFVQIPADELFPTPDNDYRVCWYRFGQDQVMFVRGRIPESRYWSLVLYNAWLESFDYTRHRIHLNHGTIEAAEDGTFEVCLAHRDPGHPNWIDTAGHHAGYLVERVLLAGEDLPELSIEVLYEKEWEARKAARQA